MATFRLLVIDGEKLIRWSLKEMFSKEKFHIDTADSWEEAQHFAEMNDYDLIIADFETERSGDEKNIESLRVFLPNVDIILLTASGIEQVENKLEQKDVFAIIEKPFRTDEARTIVLKALEYHKSQKVKKEV